ncbi:hypothetical protein H4219_005131 [Mycoemilia scoparia]|uniref:Regulator of telomere elongation helicase 1 homolog n=1 Tax=Mycoemilia scoparia TaxID=417184 RepID=A0A9W7ZQ78_9FUNG|nr:hypothetical protein H4219_005131 [Mycoemilia scoparia]
MKRLKIHLLRAIKKRHSYSTRPHELYRVMNRDWCNKNSIRNNNKGELSSGEYSDSIYLRNRDRSDSRFSEILELPNKQPKKLPPRYHPQTLSKSITTEPDIVEMGYTATDPMYTEDELEFHTPTSGMSETEKIVINGSSQEDINHMLPNSPEFAADTNGMCNKKLFFQNKHKPEDHDYPNTRGPKKSHWESSPPRNKYKTRSKVSPSFSRANSDNAALFSEALRLNSPIKKCESSTSPEVAINKKRVMESFFIGGVEVEFPFKPYTAQMQMMSQILRALKAKSNAMVESPTGSGKSLSLLCSVLGWLKHTSKQLAEEQKVLNKELGKLHTKILELGCLINEIEPFNVTEFMFNYQMSKKNATKNNKSSGNDGENKKVVKEESKPSFRDDDSSIIEVDIDQPNSSDKIAEDDDKASSKQEQQLKKEQDGPIVLSSQSQNSQPSSPEVDKYKQEIKKLLNEKDELFSKHQKLKPPKIYVTSRTHKQVDQLIKELSEKTNYRPRMAVLGSRKLYCIHEGARQSYSIEDSCQKLLDDNSCSYFRNYQSLATSKKFLPGSKHEVWDIEDLVAEGTKMKACPYYASKEITSNAELVFCPYNYIIDPNIRESTNISLENSIVIIDEAHNIEDVCRESASLEITNTEMSNMIGEINGLIHSEVMVRENRLFLGLLTNIMNWMTTRYREYDYKNHLEETKVWPDSKLNRSISAELKESVGISRDALSMYDAALQKIEEDVKSKQQTKKDIMNKNADPTKPIKDITLVYMSSTTMHSIEKLLWTLGLALGAKENNTEKDYRMAIVKKKRSNYGDNNSEDGGGSRQLTLQGGVENNGRSKLKKRRRSRKSNVLPKQDDNNDNIVDVELDGYTYTFALWCMNAGIVFTDLEKEAYSVIITSGTLSPMETYASELQAPFLVQLEANHVIKSDQVLASVVSHGPNNVRLEGKYAVLNTYEYQDGVGQSLVNLVRIIPGGVLVFFPSYTAMNKLMDRWADTGDYSKIVESKMVFMEPRRASQEEFDEMMNGYVNEVKNQRYDRHFPKRNGCILFAVHRGRISEGTDFPNELCRGVINIGIPYPSFQDVKIILKRDYNDAKAKNAIESPKPGAVVGTAQKQQQVLSGSQWYEIQAFRAINQALGRCIRHKDDWGSVILLESRFLWRNHVQKLSKWIRNDVNDASDNHIFMETLKSFIKRRTDIDAQNLRTSSPPHKRENSNDAIDKGAKPKRECPMVKDMEKNCDDSSDNVFIDDLDELNDIYVISDDDG